MMAAQPNPLEKMNLSTEEMCKFAKSMKDPKFKELLSEYAEEISQPANKETFINICYSDRLDEPKSKDRADGSGAEWQIPYSLSPIRKDKDKGGFDCQTADFIVNQEACKRARESGCFKKFLAETAIDSIQKQYGLHLDQGFVFPKLKYKGPTRNPTMLTIPSKLEKKEQVTSESYSNPDTKMGTEGLEGHARNPCVTQSHESNHKPAGEDVEYDSLSEPPYDIVYRNNLDISKFWMDTNGSINQGPEKPKEIILRVSLPNVVLPA